MKFTIGCDPEFFLRNKQGELISAIHKIGGSKWEPQYITKDGHAILEDNVAVEFNVPPSDNAKDFIHHIGFVMEHLRGMASGMNLEFAEYIASASFPDKELRTPEALVFGCEPDLNAWTGDVNPKPKADDPNLRSCGGHIHIGTNLDPEAVVKACDFFLGVPSVWMDDDTKRRLLYGNAGAFRLKPYGPEYRTLSNFWIWKEETIQWAYDQTRKALHFVDNGGVITEEMGNMICHAINKGDVDAARSLAAAYPAIQ